MPLGIRPVHTAHKSHSVIRAIQASSKQRVMYDYLHCSLSADTIYVSVGHSTGEFNRFHVPNQNAGPGPMELPMAVVLLSSEAFTEGFSCIATLSERVRPLSPNMPGPRGFKRLTSLLEDGMKFDDPVHTATFRRRIPRAGGLDCAVRVHACLGPTTPEQQALGLHRPPRRHGAACNGQQCVTGEVAGDRSLFCVPTS